PDSAAAAPAMKARRCMLSSAMFCRALPARSPQDTDRRQRAQRWPTLSICMRVARCGPYGYVVRAWRIDAPCIKQIAAAFAHLAVTPLNFRLRRVPWTGWRRGSYIRRIRQTCLTAKGRNTQMARTSRRQFLKLSGTGALAAGAGGMAGILAS